MARTVFDSNEPSEERKRYVEEPKMVSRPKSPKIELSETETMNILVGPNTHKQQIHRHDMSRLSFETLGGMPESKGLNTVIKPGETLSTIGN